jgi:hypothetical protein
MPYQPDKRGLFRNWTEETHALTIRLPIPPRTRKEDIVVDLTATSLRVGLKSASQPLLVADPFSGLAMAEESNWFLENDEMLVLEIAKQDLGATNNDKYWGSHLVPQGQGKLECHLNVAQVGKREEELAKRKAEPTRYKEAPAKVQVESKPLKRPAKASKPLLQRIKGANQTPEERQDNSLRRLWMVNGALAFVLVAICVLGFGHMYVWNRIDPDEL